jgi:(S)-ureidoglycine aminohydrolase
MNQERQPMNPFGFTRSHIARNYALITPESRVQAVLPGWSNTSGIIVISPRMGARFVQYFALMQPGGASALPLPGVERFIFVEEGSIRLSLGEDTRNLGAGGYAFLPADMDHAITAGEASRLVIFERRYHPLAEGAPPTPVIGHEQEVAGDAFMDDPAAMLKILLPTTAEFDMAVNLFTFAPGAALPLVEVHVMEHGLLLLQGTGIYRLDDAWYPVQAGDVIWMAPYCPQWFTAVGKIPARYLYYKDVGRDPLASEDED